MHLRWLRNLLLSMDCRVLACAQIRREEANAAARQAAAAARSMQLTGGGEW